MSAFTQPLFFCAKSLVRRFFILLFFVAASPSWASIPATPVMTLYRFNGPQKIPYYLASSIGKNGLGHPAGYLTQGTSVIPCVVVQNGTSLTSGDGVPYVGFELVVDTRQAGPTDTIRFEHMVNARKTLRVQSHQCAQGGGKYVLDVRNLYTMSKPPRFDPPPIAEHLVRPRVVQGELDQIVRSFHNSPVCATVNAKLVGRRERLNQAWNQFSRDSAGRWSKGQLMRAQQLDYVMRTALFEGHIGRGCSGYDACERNIIALSIRNRGLEGCAARLGCSTPGDFQGVCSKVSQYNIWDEYLTQISGLTSCFLRDDLVSDNGVKGKEYQKIEAMYRQSLPDVEQILYGNDRDLQTLFPGDTLADLKSLRHYYHAPAMGKCFPQMKRIEYMSGAVAQRGKLFALIANTRIQVGKKQGDDYFFSILEVRDTAKGDQLSLVNDYPGFLVDGRRVSLAGVASRCRPYGIPRGCEKKATSRYRKTPSWVNAGQPLEIRCRVSDSGEQCNNTERKRIVRVGGVCDTEMRPFGGIN